MTRPEARRAFSIIVDLARSNDALMGNLRSRADSDTVTIWGGEEGDLHLIHVGLCTYPDYELEWETGTMPQAVAPGEPAPESKRISLSRMTTAQMIETIFGERLEARSRRKSAIEHWHSILSESPVLSAVGPVDEPLLRALVRNENDVRGQVFVREVPEVDDYRVIWSRSLKARANIPEVEQIDLTDLNVPDAVDTISMPTARTD